MESIGYYTGALSIRQVVYIILLTLCRVLDGSTTKFMSPSHTYFSLSRNPESARKIPHADFRTGDQSIMSLRVNRDKQASGYSRLDLNLVDFFSGAQDFANTGVPMLLTMLRLMSLSIHHTSCLSLRCTRLGRMDILFFIIFSASFWSVWLVNGQIECMISNRAVLGYRKYEGPDLAIP